MLLITRQTNIITNQQGLEVRLTRIRLNMKVKVMKMKHFQLKNTLEYLRNLKKKNTLKRFELYFKDTIDN